MDHKDLAGALSGMDKFDLALLPIPLLSGLSVEKVTLQLIAREVQGDKTTYSAELNYYSVFLTKLEVQVVNGEVTCKLIN